MSWHDDKQRRKAIEEKRALKAQETETRRRAAKRAYEAGATLEQIKAATNTGQNMLRQWVKEGGWKRDPES